MKSFLSRKQSQFPFVFMMAIMWAALLGLGFNTATAGAASVAEKPSVHMADTAHLSAGAAQKVSLTRYNRDCFGQIVPPPPMDLLAHGFAIINKTGSGKLVAEVALKNATPNTTYTIRLIQTPSASDCSTIDGTLTTDDLGNGNANIQEAALVGTTDAFVVLNNRVNPNNDYFTTSEVFFP